VIDRLMVWLGTAMVTAGVAAAMIAGAGVAVADTEDGQDANGATSSESAKPTESKADSEAASEKPKPTADPKDDAEKPAEEAEPAADKNGSDTAKKAADKPAKPTKPTAVERKPEAKPTATQEPEEAEPDTATAHDLPVTEPVADVVPVSRDDHTVAVRKILVEPQTAAVAFAAPAPVPAEVTSTAATPPFAGLISAIGTIVFNLYGLAIGLLGGPPALPANSTVTVRSSTLHIDYGPGYDLPANWYFPADENPTGLIYFQHGFLASAPFYSYTAATLAEQTHSIVVAPSVTSNFFAYDNFWLGGAPYQHAVADLFAGDRQALTDSATAAIGHAVTLPEQFVIAGHSAGGGLALAAAGDMDPATLANLAGLVLLDGVAMSDAVATIDKLPDGLPVYQIASPPYAWNMYGATSDALVRARPGIFNGVQLVGGSHIDAMQGGNPLIQFGAYLLAGFSQPQNIDAVKILAVGWINDMFAGEKTSGVYAKPGDSIAIPTAAGTATAIALPATGNSLNPLDELLRLLFVTGAQQLFNPAPAGGSTVAGKVPVAA
jgi:pimeloyl-ACP methyl ester carboxylesterase